MRKEEWVLVLRTGVAPTVENWVYKSRGRRYTLSYTYYFDGKNRIHRFGSIVIDTPRKRYYFKDKVELNKFLRKRNLPPFYNIDF